MSDTKIRVRFAPSPTGFLHIGGARTALFNWLFARRYGGTFILRIEDTDEARSTDESVGAIFESLQWMGLEWDEGPMPDGKTLGAYGPYFQMQRLDLYTKYAEQLVKEGNAYRCYCTQEELDQMRKELTARKLSPKYNGKCRELTEQECKEKQAQGLKSVIRFKMPKEGKTEFNDLVRGTVGFENALLDDFVLIKASGIPTYNFACVIDDYLMRITHVLRGDDHLSNTPRQIQVNNALRFSNILQYGHLSMILGPDGSRLSKRHGATSVTEYRDQGYLPQTIMNYLALLGWSTQDSQQLFEKDDLIAKFSIEKCSRAAAVFDSQKLLWMNGEYMRKASVEKLLELAAQNKLIDITDEKKYNLMKLALTLEHEKVKLLTDIPLKTEYFVKEDITYDPKAVEKALKTPTAKDVLSDLAKKFESLDVQAFNHESLEKICREYATEKILKTSQIFHPLRVAASGRTEGPGLFEMLELLGKEKVLKRIKHVLENIIR
ncbi:MAG: glutamate--tRNA ligase [Elusimicrobia bacterium]|nr:glutamate--tRNA ligase [Elusimicrobiota bacterium]MBU2614212.1 glutamate--tRNA ligase [Elusimicrobiota bacterium]